MACSELQIANCPFDDARRYPALWNHYVWVVKWVPSPIGVPRRPTLADVVLRPRHTAAGGLLFNFSLSASFVLLLLFVLYGGAIRLGMPHATSLRLCPECPVGDASNVVYSSVKPPLSPLVPLRYYTPGGLEFPDPCPIFEGASSCSLHGKKDVRVPRMRGLVLPPVSHFAVHVTIRSPFSAEPS